MPNTILGPNGLPAHFDLPRHNKTLSLRDGEILKDVTLWEMERQLEPTLICKTCFNNSKPNTLDAKDTWSIQIALTPEGIITATCGCSRWSTEQS
jgi:hypothetical protein